MRIASVTGLSSCRAARFFSFLLVLALCMSCSACSSGRKPVHPVRGQILVDGRPAAQAQVLLHPAEGTDDDPRPTGQTDDQGYFQLTSYQKDDGASEGDYAVTVTWFRVYNNRSNQVVRYNALPKRYASPQSSQLRVSIAKDGKELTPIQLTSR